MFNKILNKILIKSIDISFEVGSKKTKNDFVIYYLSSIIMCFMYLFIYNSPFNLKFDLCLYSAALCISLIIMRKADKKTIMSFISFWIVVFLTILNIMSINGILVKMIHFAILVICIAGFYLNFRFNVSLIKKYVLMISSVVVFILVLDIYATKLFNLVSFDNGWIAEIVQNANLSLFFSIGLLLALLAYSFSCENSLYLQKSYGLTWADFPMIFKEREDLIIQDNDFFNGQKSIKIQNVHRLYTNYIILKFQLVFYSALIVFVIFASISNDLSILILIQLFTILYSVVSIYKIREYSRDKELYDKDMLNIICYAFYYNCNLDTLELLKDKIVNADFERTLRKRLIETLDTVKGDLKTRSNKSLINEKTALINSMQFTLTQKEKELTKSKIVLEK